jgi:hypothetical protein
MKISVVIEIEGQNDIKDLHPYFNEVCGNHEIGHEITPDRVVTMKLVSIELLDIFPSIQ